MRRSALIVDDDATHAQMLVEILRESGWTASTATDTADAVARIRSTPFTAVVSDAHPRGDVLGLIRALRGAPQPIPVIVTSAFGDAAASREAHAAGAFAFLPKPFYVEELLALLERAVSEIGAGFPPEGDTSP